MAQEWDEDYRQEMEKVIDLLEECDIDFKVEGDNEIWVLIIRMHSFE